MFHKTMTGLRLTESICTSIERRGRAVRTQKLCHGYTQLPTAEPCIRHSHHRRFIVSDGIRRPESEDSRRTEVDHRKVHPAVRLTVHAPSNDTVMRHPVVKTPHLFLRKDRRSGAHRIEQRAVARDNLLRIVTASRL